MMELRRSAFVEDKTMSHRRSGTIWIGIVVVLAIGLVLVALLMPAVG